MNKQEILISEMHDVIRTAARFKVPMQYLADQLDCWEKHVVIGIDDYLKWIFEYAIETATADWGGGDIHLEHGEEFDWHIHNDSLCLHIAQSGTEEIVYDYERLVAAIRQYVLDLDNQDRENCAEIEVMFSGVPRETKVVGRFCVNIGDYEELYARRHVFGIDIDLYDYVYRDNPEHTYNEVRGAIQARYDALLGKK